MALQIILLSAARLRGQPSHCRSKDGALPSLMSPEKVVEDVSQQKNQNGMEE